MKKIIFTIILIICSTMLAATEYHASKKCVDLIKQHEKCSLTAYWDVNAYSIGYGHHSKSIKKGQVITQKQADEYLLKDIAVAEKYANILLKDLPYEYKFSQGFVDGFISFVYNVGVGNAKKSILYSRLKRCRVYEGIMDKGDYHFTCAAIKNDFVKHKGNIKRRENEYKLMIS